MKRLTKKQKEAWQALYAPGDHVELGVESWKEMLDQAEQEYEARQMELLLARIPWPEEKAA